MTTSAQAPGSGSRLLATCPLCEAACGLEVDVEADRIVKIRGDRDHVASRGYLCPKGVSLGDVQHDPDRIRTPLRRVGERWHEVSWDEALDEATTRLSEVRRRHGAQALAMFVGNPTGHDYRATLGALLLARTLGTRSLYSSQSIDALPRLLTSYLMYGNQALIPIPDIDRTDFLLVLGANPAVSNGSAMSSPGVKDRLRALRQRGGRLVVVDPRRTETAALADEHLFIQPGSDAALLLGMLCVIFEEDRAAPGPAGERVDGLDEVRRIAAEYPPARVAGATGIAAETIAELARDFAAAPAAACYGRMGTCVQAFGALSSWLIDVLNLVTGNLDRPGGVMFPTPAVDLAGLASALGQAGSYGRWRSRVSGLPEFAGELPVAAFAEELETPGPGQPRALVVHAGNPVLSLPNGRRIEQALRGLDFMVSIDIYRNETSRLADLILPSTFGLERDDYPLLALGTAVHDYARYVPAGMPRPAGVRDAWEIATGLTSGLLRRRGLLGRAGAWALDRLTRGVDVPRAVLALSVRLGPHGAGLRPWGSGLTLRDIEQAPHGVDLGPLRPRLPGVLRTRGRRIDLAPAPMREDLARLQTTLDRERPALRLLGRRHLRSNNSWMHNTDRLVRGRDRCTLQLHPADAKERGITSGQQVELRSRIGTIVVPVEVTDEVMPGVATLPHGYGHDRPGVTLAVAQRRPGRSINDITDDGAFDAVSGCSDLASLEVEVEAVTARASVAS